MMRRLHTSTSMTGTQFLLIFFLAIATAVSLETGHLPKHEMQALGQIAKELGKSDWDFSLNPCDGNPNWNTTTGYRWMLYQSILICNCSFPHGVCHVEQLILRRQDLAGVLPRSVAKLPYLKTLDLDRNYLSGGIPQEWASLTRLENLLLTANRLSGPIPEYVGNITTLVLMSLETNMFSGEVPAELGKLINLEKLVLSCNNLTGKLPVQLYGLKNLRQLKLSSNEFTGKMPSFQGLRNLQILQLQSSGFQGPIPSEISTLDLTELWISNLKGGDDSEFPNLGNMTGMSKLVLSSCHIYGEIPNFFGNLKSLMILDLSFNKLQGSIPDLAGLKEPYLMYLTANNLSGPLPEWIKYRGPNKQIDLSYNNFDKSSLPCSRDTLNLFKSYNGTNDKDVGTCLRHCSKEHYSFHVNCGGPTTRVGKIVYEEDEWPLGSQKFDYRRENWGSSSTGTFWDTTTENYIYTPKNTSLLQVKDPQLYTTARASPLSLTYYGRCLANGNYTIKLHFAEIVFRGNKSYQSLGRRMFDVYIQGELRLQDFDIEREANGVDKAVIRQFDAVVANTTLEIRFQYTGKGTTAVPVRGSYGSLISAISVESDFKPPSDVKKKIIISIGVVTGLALTLGGVICFFWWNRRKIPGGQDLTRADVQGGAFTFNQIQAVTNNFSAENKLGEGGFGVVYKGTLLDGMIIAVKKLQIKNRTTIQEFVNEIGIITALRHPNLLRLYGCCIGGNHLVLVYEFMENNNLGRALYGPEECRLQLDWPTRHEICKGIARGLNHLHESPLQVVHRDIKPSNILLDRDLSPKISDFGTAKVNVDFSEDRPSSGPAVGTTGYTAPEYALHHKLTLKADVYSFGVAVLEIVHGVENLKCQPTENFSCLVEWAAFIHVRGDLMDLVDPRLRSNFNRVEAEQVIKVIRLALLCISPTPALRPTMSQIVNILEGNTTIEEFNRDPAIYEKELELKKLRESSSCFFLESGDPEPFDAVRHPDSEASGENRMEIEAEAAGEITVAED